MKYISLSETTIQEMLYMKHIMLLFEQSIGINFIQSYCRHLYLYSLGVTSAVRSHVSTTQG